MASRTIFTYIYIVCYIMYVIFIILLHAAFILCKISSYSLVSYCMYRIMYNKQTYCKCLRGVFRIKCAGRNIFNTSHSRNSAISGLFKALLAPIRTYWSQQSIYRQKAAAGQFLFLVSATPSKFFMRLTWDSESLAGFDFASLKQKKIRRGRIRQIERLADRL